jgi:hypothetical protein
MSNQRGDRYTCSDPNCGCVIEVKEPSASFRTPTDARTAAKPVEAGYADATDDLRDRGHGVPAAGSVSERGFRSENIATGDDYGKQGTSGEGIFGTVGGGDSDHVHTEGRYGSRLPRKSGFVDDARTSASGGAGAASSPASMEAIITCFCGSVMRPAGAADRARSASA